MAGEPEEVEFVPSEPDAVVARMRDLARDHVGWVNFTPVLPEGVEGPRQGLLRFLGARGPEALMATWVPGERRKDGYGPTTVGVQHAAGRRLVTGKGALGLRFPEEWRLVQDHPARGLVAHVPDDAELDHVVGWLLATATEATSLPLTGKWRAQIYSAT
jgi:hypothetical protein